MEIQEKKQKGKGVGGLIFVGCMFLGAGIGMYFNDVRIGGAIGMGVGFIFMGLIKLRYKD